MNFLGSDERQHLQKLGLRILDEEETRVPLAKPYYELAVRFQHAGDLAAFRDRSDLESLGVSRTAPVRASSGEPDPRQLLLCFDDRAAAKTFRSNGAIASEGRFEFRVREPQRVSQRTIHRVLVQFDDQGTISRLRNQLDLYGRGASAGTGLTAKERSSLLDALESVDQLGPDDRRGTRLRAEGFPDGEASLDVDLWHPGSPPLVQDVIRDFGELVRHAGGRVTDGPRTVAETLLLARVRGSSAVLNALLNYEHVAYVDLPPRMPLPEFSVFSVPSIPPSLPPIPENGPLACVIDSGVVAGHPLLTGTIVDERDFESGEATPVDTVGHGTAVAGVVVYGDIQRCLSEEWTPRVQILSAKVMRQGPMGDAEFADEERVTTQIRNAVEAYQRGYGCRVFNLSIGHADRPLTGRRQLPWALLLDELARELDVVFVVSVGNVPHPNVPDAATTHELQEAVRDQLLSTDHVLIDPASAALAVTVGAVSRGDQPYVSPPDFRPAVAGAPADCPAPFTRAGVIETSGATARRAVKPELVAYGGNYCLQDRDKRWTRNNPHLTEKSLNYAFATGRPLTGLCGSTLAAAQVTHCCAIVEAELRTSHPRGKGPSANLIRALVVHGARRNKQLEQWMGGGHGAAERRALRVGGYGVTEPDRAAFSADNRVVLIAEDSLEEDHFHLYELEIPTEFLNGAGSRSLRVTLAYDPPVRGTRREYLARTMRLQLFRGLQAQQIFDEMARVRTTEAELRVADKNKVPIVPSGTQLQWSTVQSVRFAAKGATAFNYPAGKDGAVLFHILVACTKRFDAGGTTQQPYALVASLEHADGSVRLYNAVRQRVQERVRVSWGS
jgi:hypothetical protein